MEMEAMTMEVQRLAREVRQRRGALGLTQEDVGLGLATQSGNAYSQTTICRFEAGQLSLQNMVKLLPDIHKFLDLVENNGGIGERAQNPPTTVRKKTRTYIKPETTQLLEVQYRRCKRPNNTDLGRIAETVGLEKKVVSIWFCNRRQKERKMNAVTHGQPNSVMASPAFDNLIPAPALPYQPTQMDPHYMAASQAQTFAVAPALPYQSSQMDPFIIAASQGQNISAAPAHPSAWTGVMDLGLQGSSVQGNPPYWGNIPSAWTRVTDLGLQGSSVQGNPPFCYDPSARTDMANSPFSTFYMSASH